MVEKVTGASVNVSVDGSQHTLQSAIDNDLLGAGTVAKLLSSEKVIVSDGKIIIDTLDFGEYSRYDIVIRYDMSEGYLLFPTGFAKNRDFGLNAKPLLGEGSRMIGTINYRITNAVPGGYTSGTISSSTNYDQEIPMMYIPYNATQNLETGGMEVTMTIRSSLHLSPRYADRIVTSGWVSSSHYNFNANSLSAQGGWNFITKDIPPKGFEFEVPNGGYYLYVLGYL